VPDQALIKRIEKAGAEYEENERGWGFVNGTDKALALIGKLAGVQMLDLFESCDAGDVSRTGIF
jgi:hypothetical protein